jgi:dynein heavy chain, axonemal
MRIVMVTSSRCINITHGVQVLDDNKKLCLVSGEIIQLSSSMTMMFEVEDLAVASPATVSRCGMVYMEPETLGLVPLLDSWLQGLFDGVFEHSERLRAMFTALVPPLIHWVRRNVRETITTVDPNLCVGCFRIFDALLATYHRSELNPLDATTRSHLATLIPPVMLFAVVWSVGGSCDKASRPAFDVKFRETLAASGWAPSPPSWTPYCSTLLNIRNANSKYLIPCKCFIL